MAETKRKTLHYRRASFLNSKSNLQSLLSAALAKFGLVKDREEDLSDNGSVFKLINAFTHKLDLAFGDLITYEVGTNKLLLTMDKTVPFLDIRQLQPPRLDKQDTQFLDGHLYYGIKNNHVVVMQSSLRVKDLESYLNWFLWKAGVLAHNDRLELLDSPTPELRKRIEQSSAVKSIQLGAPVLNVERDSQLISSKQESVKLTRPGIGARVIEALLGKDEFEKLDLTKAIDGNLKVAIEITYDRKTSQGGQQVINTLARAFRNVDAEDYAVDMPGVGTIKGADLKLSDTVSVLTHNGVVDGNDLLLRMNAWLTSLIERNLVSASS